MDCPVCAERTPPREVELGASHKVYAGPGIQTRRQECPVCHTVFTSVEWLIGENKERGQGAHGLAKRILSGKFNVKVEGA